MGRPKGSKNKRHPGLAIATIDGLRTGNPAPPASSPKPIISPLEFMLKCMQGDEDFNPTPLQFEAAKQALPYVHAKVSPKPEAVEQITDQPRMSDMELARRIAFALTAMREELEAQGTKTIEGEAT